ncbi:MAG: hypothetical protein IPG66_06600 [Hydrogenophilales bacterium]|nr:hypothetical protein [Hydrogenophilales bacterium]
MKTTLAALFLGMVVAFPALAGDTPLPLERITTPKKGGGCYVITMGAVGWDVKVKCDHLGEITIKQIYENGWRIVSSHLNQDRALHVIFIEEQ